MRGSGEIIDDATGYGNELPGEVISNLTNIMDEFAEGILEGGVTMIDFQGSSIPLRNRYDEEYNLDFVEGFGADSIASMEFVEGESTEDNVELFQMTHDVSVENDQIVIRNLS